MKKLLYFLALVGLFSLALGGVAPAAAQDSPTAQPLTGVLTVLHGDPPPGSNLPTPDPRFQVTPPDGSPVTLAFDAGYNPPYAALQPLLGQTVTVSGALAAPAGDPALQQDATGSVLHVESLASAEKDLDAPTPAAVYGSKPWITLMCKFKDYTSEPKNLAYFQGMYGDTPGLLNHFWKEVSNNQVDVAGSSVVGWLTLPRNRSAYLSGGAFDTDLAAQDCAGVADAQVNFAAYTGINMMFNAELDSYAWGGSHAFSPALDGKNYFYVTWEPPWGYEDIVVIAHEMGHGFGLPHSSFSAGYPYDSAWDVMSNGWAGCNSFNHVTYGCMPQGTISYHKDMLGWIPAGQKLAVARGQAASVTLSWLGAASSSGYRLLTVAIPGGNEFYTVEARGYTNTPSLSPWPTYDQKLDDYLAASGHTGVIIHRVNPNAGFNGQPARVVDLDGNSAGDAGAVYSPGETFTDSTNQISVKVVSAVAGGLVVEVNNAAVAQAPTSVTVAAPPMAFQNVAINFKAVVWPGGVGTPVTYTWTATGVSQQVHTLNAATDTAVFNFPSGGSKTVTVTAQNSLGSKSTSFTIYVQPSSAGHMCAGLSGVQSCRFLPFTRR